MQEIVVIDGEIELENTLDGEVELEAITDLDPEVVLSTGGAVYPHYTGSYTVTPSGSVQTLDTSDKVMDDDVTIEAVAQGSATTPQTIITADPTISVSNGGLITATVSKTQQITPTVQEGYVSAGTPGNVGVAGSNTQQLTVQSAQTIHPASTDQSIASGKYLTGAQTFKAVTVSGLTADKILQGNTVKIGDADDDDRIMSVTGTASGGITPTGTKQISVTENGTVTEDVTNYSSAKVTTNVPDKISTEDSVPYLFRQSGGGVRVGTKEEDTIVGGSIAWNQLVQIANGSKTDLGITATFNSTTGEYALSGTSSNTYARIFDNFRSTINHIYIATFTVTANPNNVNITEVRAINIGWDANKKMGKASQSVSTAVAILGFTTGTDFTGVKLKANIHDLTQMFGSTIADYIYALETAHTGDGVSYFKNLFQKPYYAYNAGELVHVSGLTSHEMKDSNDTVIGSYSLDSTLTLRGIPKVANGKVCYDGDTYASDGTVTRKYGIVDLGSLTWKYVENTAFNLRTVLPVSPMPPATALINANAICSNTLVVKNYNDASTDDNSLSIIYATSSASGRVWVHASSYTTASAFNTAMNGVYLVYELATPTTETATGFTNPQAVDADGTEEYVITTTADVAVPVGHVTKYPYYITSADNGKVVNDGELVAQSSKSISANGTVDTTYNNSVTVNVPNSYSASDEGKVVSNGVLVAQSSDTVTANDTYDTTLINSLTVNVSGGGGDTLAERCNGTLTTYSSDAITTVANYAFTGSGIQSLELPNCTEVGINGLRGLTSLTDLKIHNVTKLNTDALNGSSALTVLAIPKCTSITTRSFNNNTNLHTLEIGVLSTVIASAPIATLILRKSSVVALNATTYLKSDIWGSSATGGTLYVPSDLVSSYQSATNWSTILGYANNKIKSIESTHTDPTAPIDLTLYYADGAPIPTT